MESTADCTEPYFDQEKGELGLIILKDTWLNNDAIKTFSEWKECNPKYGKELEAAWVDRIEKLIWYLPGRPDISSDDPTLLSDLVSVIKDYVEFPDDRLYWVYAHWIICTYLIDWIAHAPRIIVTAPTEHGKGRVLKLARLLAYRGAYLGDPTLAVTFRLTSWERATIIIDEFQDVLPEETRRRILNVFRLGFEVGAVIPRMNNDNSDFDNFKTHSFWLIASKNLEYPEDVQNRAILISMRKRTREIKGEPSNDEQFTKIRTRLMAFRLRVFLGKVDLNQIKNNVELYLNNGFQIRKENVINPLKKVALSDRTRDKARTLLIPSMIWGGANEIIETLVDSQIRASDDQRNTSEAMTFYAFQSTILHRCKISDDLKKKTNGLRDLSSDEVQKLISTHLKSISVNEITDQFNTDIQHRENIVLRDSDRVKTRTIGTILRTLSFKTRTGSGNKSYLSSTGFYAAYRSCIESFGSRYDEDSEAE